MPRLTYSTAALLEAMSNGNRHGFDMMTATGLPSGTVYPALRRLEKHGWVKSRWESEQEMSSALGPPSRPRRRYYTLTAAGVEAFETAIARYPALASRQLRTEPT